MIESAGPEDSVHGEIGSCGHLPAFFGTAPAGGRPLLAVIGIVLRISFHLPGGERAEVRAAPVQADAPGHHLNLFLSEALTGAVFAGQGTGLAGFNTFLVILHYFYSVSVGYGQLHAGCTPMMQLACAVAKRSRRSALHLRMLFCRHAWHVVVGAARRSAIAGAARKKRGYGGENKEGGGFHFGRLIFDFICRLHAIVRSEADPENRARSYAMIEVAGGG